MRLFSHTRQETLVLIHRKSVYHATTYLFSYTSEDLASRSQPHYNIIMITRVSSICSLLTTYQNFPGYSPCNSLCLARSTHWAGWSTGRPIDLPAVRIQLDVPVKQPAMPAAVRLNMYNRPVSERSGWTIGARYTPLQSLFTWPATDRADNQYAYVVIMKVRNPRHFLYIGRMHGRNYFLTSQDGNQTFEVTNYREICIFNTWASNSKRSRFFCLWIICFN